MRPVMAPWIAISCALALALTGCAPDGSDDDTGARRTPGSGSEQPTGGNQPQPSPGMGGSCWSVASYTYPGCPDGGPTYNAGYVNWDLLSCAVRSIRARYPCDPSTDDCVAAQIQPRCSGIPMCGYPMMAPAKDVAAFTAEVQAEIDKYCTCADFTILFLC